jgi:hypothetical protein
MFDWCKGADLRALVQANVAGAAYDDWLVGWMHAVVQSRFKLWAPVDMLDVELGPGPRPHREMFQRLGARLDVVDVASLASSEQLADRRRKYDLITLLSLEREQCLQPLDFANPLPFAELLLNTAALLNNGGVLIWSHLYCFASGPQSVRALLEPAALFQMLELRDFVPMAREYPCVDKVALFHDLDTLFVRHQAILEHSSHQERVTRVCCAIKRRGRCRVRFASSKRIPGGLLRRNWVSLQRRISFLVRS